MSSVRYAYADDNRNQGTFLLDLGSEKGRVAFAAAVDGILNKAAFTAVQFDGFEKLQLISATDFNHSAQTYVQIYISLF